MNTRRIAQALLVVLLLVPLAGAQPAESLYPAGGDTAVIEPCKVYPAKELDVSAAEPGLLFELTVKEGSRVDEDEEIGRVDDRQPQMMKKVAEFALRQAKNRYEDRIDEEYAVKAHEVAVKEYEAIAEANKRTERAFTQVEEDRARLDATRAELAIKKAVNDRKLALDDFYTKRAEYEAAEMAIARRVVLAPAKGEVVRLLHEKGEWVNPGEPILQLVQLDTLHVEGKLDVERYDPREVMGCDVTVDVMVGGGRRTQATGKIVWISPITLRTGEWVREVRAEITNEWDGHNWKIYPGADAKMTIHLGTADIRVSKLEE
jgi:multidrug resistance efflux pump